MTFADLYKVDITIPLAFDLVAQQVDDVSVAARRGIRDRMKDGKFMQRCVKDIRSLLLTPDEAESDSPEVEDIILRRSCGLGLRDIERAAKITQSNRTCSSMMMGICM